MKEFTIPFDRDYLFKVSKKEEINISYPTVIIFLKQTSEKDIYEAFANDILQNPSKDLFSEPKTTENIQSDMIVYFERSTFTNTSSPSSL